MTQRPQRFIIAVGLPFSLVALESQAGLSETRGNGNLEPAATGRRTFPPSWRLGLGADGTPGRKGGQLVDREFLGAVRYREAGCGRRATAGLPG